ncbi:MAG: hypothetical protein JRH18_09410 [Deltaproteobacteria bacterium]|nr:hypothetical protein [Deltaproteobacteria bacterium]MBW2151870.1 hypothetical protein [Deltaproteobacteria bacterium]
MNIVEKIDDSVKVRHVLVSVSDKAGLEEFTDELVRIDPEIKLFSTGGTYQRVKEALGSKADGRLVQVSEYTGQPETQGGLVKTLDFKIYLGLLTETYNQAHQEDLKRTAAVPIDMVVVNLYPFQQTVEKHGVMVEEARANIDIGGPCMIRAAAKNFIRVASVVDPSDYKTVIAELQENNGHTSLSLRFSLAQKAFEHTARYDRAIADYLSKKGIDEVRRCYRI